MKSPHAGIGAAALQVVDSVGWDVGQEVLECPKPLHLPHAFWAFSNNTLNGVSGADFRDANDGMVVTSNLAVILMMADAVGPEILLIPIGMSK